MYTDELNKARIENAKTLASIIGVGIEEAYDLLRIEVLLTFDQSSNSKTLLAKETFVLLEKTVSNVKLNSGSIKPDIEIVIGDCLRQTSSKTLYVDISNSNFRIQSTPISSFKAEQCHSILILISACYLCAAALSTALDLQPPIKTKLPLDLYFNDLTDLTQLENSIELGSAYLAGAGAVGSAFLWALRHFNVNGELTVADYDTVDAGNLNRQIWFREEDIGQAKAGQVVSRAQDHFPSLQLKAEICKLQEIPKVRDNAKSLKRLIVGVDSRRARRSLQNLIPGEVFDASTTDATEIILHHHKQPNERACLSCIYYINEQERSRDEIIAKEFGLPVEEIRKQRVSPFAAQTIVLRYPDQEFQQNVIEGLAFESLYKSLCGQGALNKKGSTKQLLAPFCFVSILAGSMLALDLFNRLSGIQSSPFNYWKVSAWTPPLVKNQRLFGRRYDCEFCGEEIAINLAKSRWSNN